MKKYYYTNSVLNYQMDLHFFKHKLAIEVDEKGHTDRNEKKRKQKRRRRKKKSLDLNLLN